jgi:hypothetical protein
MVREEEREGEKEGKGEGREGRGTFGLKSEFKILIDLLDGVESLERDSILRVIFVREPHQGV